APAQVIEATGYTGVSTKENRHEPFLSLAVAGAATRRIELHTSVAIAFARSPMTCANVGWDLAAPTRGQLYARARQPGAGAQRAALLGAVVAAGAAHARVRAGHPRDLGGLEGRRQ